MTTIPSGGATGRAASSYEHQPFSPPSRDAAALDAARAALAALFGPPARRRFAVRYWDGSVDAAASDAPPFTLVVRHAGALRRAFLPPSELALAEAYLHDDLDVEGSLEAAATLGDDAAAAVRSPAAAVRLARALLALPRGAASPNEPVDEERGPLRARGMRHSRRRDAATVRFHYDVGNDFYALWLDRRMIYSCAYFPTGSETIDEAQEAKLEHICRKLRLSRGDRLLDIGCGWGGLLEYAATRYGVSGMGITLSERQAEVARARLAAAGVADRVSIALRDYRDLEGEAGAFDRIVSVGMREHVGAARLPDYFAAAHQLLRPGGLFLDHGITRGGTGERPTMKERVERRLWRRDAFIQRYVFPDGELVPIGALLSIGERTGLEARDVESLREHYAATLRHWVRRLEARHDEAAALVGETTYRVWRVYMAATVLGFLSGRINICQTLYAKPDASGRAHVPSTRADLYRA